RSGGRPVLLQHGLLSSSFDFISPQTYNALSYSLADAGYDVWLGNSRGNIYSDKHTMYSKSDPRFWNFTWDDMAMHDFPAIIDYILRVSNRRRLYVVGHSQGALTFIASSSMHPQLQWKVKHFFALAPALSSLYARSSFLSDMSETMTADTFDESIYYGSLFREICGSTELRDLCYALFEEFSGPIRQVDWSQLPLVTSHFPGGTSNKNLKHWLQQMRSGTRYFDYGANENLAVYGTTHPREYNFYAYSVPTSIYFSPADKLVTSEDIKIALHRLPPSTIVKTRNLTNFGHFEFIWGNRAKAEIYNEIIDDMNRMDSNRRYMPRFKNTQFQHNVASPRTR
ncbi:hypothetical protein PMAYCL1PPCAC_09630, partial [Pristionchus mayeri]